MNPTSPENLRQAAEKVFSVYSDLEKLGISRDCILRNRCCRFRLTGKKPMLTLGEAIVLARGLREAGRSQIPPSQDGDCPFLDQRKGLCTLYAHRPFGCRSHFCNEAGGTYKRSDIVDLIRRLEAIDADLGGDTPHEITSATQTALSLLKTKR